MATLDISGQEKQIAEFLQTVDLEIRADEEKTMKLKSIVQGSEKITDYSIFLQHGGQVTQGCIQIPASESFAKILLRTAQDAVQNISFSLKNKGNFTEVIIINKNPTLFKFTIPTNEI